MRKYPLMMGDWKETSFFLFFCLFKFFLLRRGNVFDGEYGNKERYFFLYFLHKKIIIFFVGNTKNAAKYENNHQQADPATSPFSFRYFTMWRILMSSRYVLPLQPAKEMLISAEETPKWVDTEEETVIISVPVFHMWYFYWHDNFEQHQDISEEFIRKRLKKPL